MGLISRVSSRTYRFQLSAPKLPQNAPTNHRDQRLPPQGPSPRRQPGLRQEEQERLHQVQGQVLQVPVHLERGLRGEGQEAQGNPSPSCPGQGDQRLQEVKASSAFDLKNVMTTKKGLDHARSD